MTAQRVAPGSASMPRPFSKGHGTRNDFVILDDPDGIRGLSEAEVARLADRRSGIGGDGVIRVVRTASADIDAPADAPEWCMDYRNADGSIAEMCGNGVRVFAAYLDRAGRIDGTELAIWTRAGVRTITICKRPGADAHEWTVQVGMGMAGIEGAQRTVHIAGHELDSTDINMGNPHTVAFLPEGLTVDDLDLSVRPRLSPEPEGGSNIELVEIVGDHHVRMRVHERGVGETESCGTGAAAVGVAAALHTGDASRTPWRVDVPGGTVEIGWTDSNEVTLTGPAVLVADGTTTL